MRAIVKRRTVPTFALYGESAGTNRTTEALHLETIQARSRKYLWRIGSHRHVGVSQCLYVTQGPAWVDLESSHQELEGPLVIIIPAGVVHGFGFKADTQGYVMTTDLGRLLDSTAIPHQAVITALFTVPQIIDLRRDPALADRLPHVFGALMQEFAQPDSRQAPVAGWLACSALWMLATAAPASMPSWRPVRRDLDRLRRFQRLIDAHVLEHWSVGRYAAELAVSESSLNRLCRDLAGGTAFDVIQRRLGLEARRRLIYVAAPIRVIAAQLGFKDTAYFCRFFRRHCGSSPSAFRRCQGVGVRDLGANPN